MQIEGGIYVYWFNSFEEGYVGSTTDFKKRHREHTKALSRNKHTNNRLQYAYNKYNFEYKLKNQQL